MTPMEMLKNQFDEFKIIAKNYREITLNKSEPKDFSVFYDSDIVYVENKGVKSDFIKLFKIKFNKENQYSIGFEFKYIDLKKEDYKVRVSLKQGEENYFINNYLNIEEFRDKFKSLIIKLNDNKNLENKDLIEIIKQEFELIPKSHLKKKYKPK